MAKSVGFRCADQEPGTKESREWIPIMAYLAFALQIFLSQGSGNLDEDVFRADDWNLDSSLSIKMDVKSV